MGMTRQLASGAKDLGGGGARFAGSPLYVQDIACDDLRTLRCLLHVTGDPARRGALLFHRCCHTGCNRIHFADGGRNSLDRENSVSGIFLDLGHLAGDLLGGTAVGSVVALGWWGTGYAGDDPFNPQRVESFSFVAPLGEALMFVMTASGPKLDLPRGPCSA
jgi:hypothetical protein